MQEGERDQSEKEGMQLSEIKERESRRQSESSATELTYPQATF